MPLIALADDPDLAAVAEGRLALLEMAEGIDPLEVGREVAPYLVPDPPTLDAVLAQQAEEGGATRRRDLADVPGGPRGPGRGHRRGRRRCRSTAWSTTWRRRCAGPTSTSPPARLPCSACAGGADEVAPAAFARWWADLLPHATVEVVDGAGHALHLAHWTRLLAHASSTA